MHHPTRHGTRARRLATLPLRLLRAAFAALLLAALLAGVPWALTHYIGWPLPDRPPSRDDILTTLSHPLTTRDTLRVLACLLWPAWALFTADLARALAEAATTATRPARLRPRRPTHALATALVGMLTLGPLLPHQPGRADPSTTATAPLHDAPRSTSSPAASHDEPPASTVTVLPPQDGVHDSLWRIADRHLGDGARWPEIYHLNEGRLQPDGGRLTKPSLIRPGWTLQLPTTRPPTDERENAPDRRPGEEPPPAPEPSEPPQQNTPAPEPTPPPSTPAPHDTPPALTPTNPPQPPTADGTDTGSTLVSPTGAFVGIGLAALVTAIWATVRIRRRTQYQPGSSSPADDTMPPIVRTLRLAYDNTRQTSDEAEFRDLPPQPAPPPTAEAATRQRARAVAQATSPAALPAAGTRDGQAIALDLARTRGLGLTGPGSPGAARSMLITLLADHHRSGAAPAHLIAPARDIEMLLDRQATQPPHPPRLHLTRNLAEALDTLENELLSRRRDPRTADQTEIVLLAVPEPQHERRLQAVLDNGSDRGITGILLGPWHPGTTIRLQVDGTITAAAPTAPDPLRPGGRLFTLPPGEARDLHQLLREAAPTSSSPPATTGDSRPTTTAENDERATPPPEAETESTTNQYDETRTAPLRLHVLGRTELRLEDQTLTTHLAPRHREVLAFLALHPNGVHRDVLVAALWPDAPHSRPNNAFHATVSQLRRALRTADAALSDIIRHDDSHYALNRDLVAVDLWDLHAALADQRRPGKDVPQQLAGLRYAGELYRGDFAADVSAGWAETPREALRRDVLDAHSTLIRATRDSDPEEALTLLEQARKIDPYNEAIYRGIGRVQALLGRHDAVARTLALLETSLAEIEEEPSGTSVRFLEALTRIDPSGGQPLGKKARN